MYVHIFDNGRIASGVNRGYVLDNIKQAVNSDFTQERIRLREAVGYVGHGLREMVGKLDIGETETVNLGNGQRAVVKAIPACVTTDLSIDDQGNLTHTQEILDNDEGKTLLGLHKSRVGGFSWASNGAKGIGRTLVDKIFGFDYVVNPNFVANRGYVMDSANDEPTTLEMILDNMNDCGLEADTAKERLESWWASTAMEVNSYQDELSACERELIELRRKNEALQVELQQITDSAVHRETLIRDFAANSSIGVDPEKLIQFATAETAADLTGFQSILDSAAGMEKSVIELFGDGQEYQVPSRVWHKERQYRMDQAKKAKTDPVYGSIDTVPELSNY